MREVAKRLDLAPNALYHHFKNRGELESEIAAEGFRRLHQALEKAAGQLTGSEAVIETSRAYLEFARAHPTLYDILYKKHDPSPGLHRAVTELQEFSRKLLSWLGSDQLIIEAQLALFAMMHGIAIFEPREGFNPNPALAVSALLTGLKQVK